VVKSFHKISRIALAVENNCQYSRLLNTERSLASYPYGRSYHYVQDALPPSELNQTLLFRHSRSMLRRRGETLLSIACARSGSLWPVVLGLRLA
jgi:hypothetical protein